MKKIQEFGFDKDPMIKTYEEVKLENKINEIINYLNQEEPEGKYKKGDKVRVTLADKDGWIAGEFGVANVEAQPERTFTNQELGTIRLLMSTANPQIIKEIIGQKKYDRLWVKISKLLKE